MSASEHDGWLEGHLAAILESVEDAVISVSLEGVVTTWNRGAEKVFGYTAAEMIGKSIEILSPPDRPEEESRILERLRRGQKIDHYETQRVRKDGQRIDVSLTVCPIKDNMGQIIGISTVARDISDRKRLEKAEMAESFLAALVDSADDAIVSKTFDGIVTSWNKAAEKIFGYSATEMMGRSISVLIPADHPNEEPEILARIRRGERIEHYVTQRVKKDGSHIYVSLTVSPIKDGLGRIVGASKIAQDITERQLAQERERKTLQEAREAKRAAEEASRSKDEFLATVSHELRTPMTAILGWTRMLAGGQLDAELQKKAISTIDRNARSQAQLVEDLLDISRIVSGRLRIEVKSVDPATVISAAVESLRPAAEAKKIRIQTILDSQAGPVAGDPERLQQVIWNLLSNAIKFTPKEGRVQVELRRANSQIELSVTDSGIGISEDFIPRVFNRFSQADSSITRVHGGLGMGLAIVKSIVELHGGTVSASSPGVGEGSTFTVKLPLSANQRRIPQPVDRVEPPIAEMLSGHSELVGLRVLIVDDEADTCEMLRYLFEKIGADVRTARSATEALSLLQSWHPHILISDIGMPEVDGYELIRRVRTELNSRIPAVALTALTRIEDRVKVRAAGFQMHVAKPVEPVELVSIVASLARLVDHGRPA